MRRIWILLPVAVVSAVALFVENRALAGDPRHGPVASFTMSVLFASLAIATARALELSDKRWPSRHRWVRRLGMVLGGSVTGLAAFPFIEFRPDRAFVMDGPRLFMSVCLNFAFVGAFALVAETIHGVTRRSRSVTARLVALGFACAIVGAAMAYWVEAQVRIMAGVGRAVAVGVTGVAAAGIAMGFSAAMAYPLSRGLKAIAEALRQVAGGDLEARVEPKGRDEVAQISEAFNLMTGELREKDFLERAFGRYVTRPVLEALRGASDLSLSGQRREATILFADIRGFTSMSETLPPERVMDVLNRYFTGVLGVVERHEGYVNKFIGDAVMVVFNAPLEQPDHAARAVRCAREMQAEIARLNAEGAFAELRVDAGIGVNTGPVVAGTLGGERRAEYTVIGDAVNVASRLTSKAGRGEVLLGARAASLGGDSAVEALEPLVVKGKSAPLEVFRLRAA